MLPKLNAAIAEFFLRVKFSNCFLLYSKITVAIDTGIEVKNVIILI